MSNEFTCFQKCFPLFSWIVLHPISVAVCFLLTSLAVYAISPVYSLGLVCLWTGIFSFYLERRLLDRILFPPFTSVACWGALGTGLGLPIMYSSAYFQEFYKVYEIADWVPSILAAQASYLLSFPFAWFGYWIGGFRKVSKVPDRASIENASEINHKRLLLLAWLLFSAAVVILVVKSFLGIDDRSGFASREYFPSSAVFVSTLILKIIPKLGMMGFVFVPFLWQSHKLKGKIAICFLLLLYLAFAISSGTRGFLLYMMVFLFVGSYFFRRKDSNTFEFRLGVLLLLAGTLVFILLAFRTSLKFHETGSANILARLQALVSPSSFSRFSFLSSESAYRFGYSLYGVDDMLIFAFTPKQISHVGVDNFSAVLWTWIPTTLYKDKPVLLDAELVTGQYENPPVLAKTGTSISLWCDAFRRFGWWGIPIVVFISFSVYGALIRWCYYFFSRGSLFGWCLLVFSFMFFWSRPFSTVLATWWSFFYDTPKQLVFLGIVCAFICVILNTRIGKRVTCLS